MYIDKPLKNYLIDLASKSPSPGGGSAATLVGALGVGLISMVANFTLGRQKYKDVEQEIAQILSSSERLRERLARLVDEDIKIYKKVSTAYRLPKETAEEGKRRKDTIEDALKEALAIPLDVCRCCHEAIRLCALLADKGNINLISDVGVSVALIESAFYSALLNVYINLKGVKDEKFIIEIREIIDPLEEELKPIKDQVWEKVNKELRR